MQRSVALHKLATKRGHRSGVGLLYMLAWVALITQSQALAQVPDVPPPLEPLIGKTPRMPDIASIIKNRTAAQQLGKALFWDISVGSDNIACATCHNEAGVDLRIKNQVAPGLTRVDASGSPNPDRSFSQKKGSYYSTGPNEILTARDFDFRTLSNPNNRNSTVLYGTNDVFTSSGTFSGKFISSPQTPYKFTADNCSASYDPSNPFHKYNWMYRNVEPRNSPTVINSAFNYRNFWDGRASNVFNGVDPFGESTNSGSPKAGVVVNVSNRPQLKKLALTNASTASQAVGPALSTFEMSCQGRTFADLGKRVVPLIALRNQIVSRTDSLFSLTTGLVSFTRGLTVTYDKLIRAAFDPKYYSLTGKYSINADGSVSVNSTSGYTQMELNFSMFFGLAILEYEATLKSDQSPFDKGQLTAQQLRGKATFEGKGKCIACHNGPLFTNAAVTAQDTVNPRIPETMVMGDGGVSTYDQGFYNVGVLPTSEDIGIGAKDPWGKPLSFTRQEKIGGRIAVDGGFKNPTMRNIALTPPYFHTGGSDTLEKAVQFYNRGGNRVYAGCGDTTGFAGVCSNLDADITNLGMTVQEIADIVAFMKALTDPRVACHQGPFDHPELPIPNGHVTQTTTRSSPARAPDIIVRLPATGVGGLPAIGKQCFPNSGSLAQENAAFESIVAK